MKGRQPIFIISIFLSCCHSTEKKHSLNQPVPKDTSTPGLVVKPQPPAPLKTHLHDTTLVDGSFILFLRPNDARYAELETISDDIGDGDSDFGVGINNTLDSLKSNPRYKHVKGLISTDRYIKIRDCLDCPLVIDRDTINYGYIMSAKGKHIDSVFYSVHSGNYLEEMDSYFFGKSL